MSKHIHIWGHRASARDAFEESKATQQKPNPLTGKPLPVGFEPWQKEMKKHSNYSKK